MSTTQTKVQSTEEALKLALEALQVATTPLAKDRQEVLRAITAIKEALAQPAVAEQHKQEPVALRHSFDGYGYLYTDMGFGSGWIEWTKRSHKDAEPLYTTPYVATPRPQRTAAVGEDTKAWVNATTWRGLTDDDCFEALKAIDSEAKRLPLGFSMFAANIQAKLKEKNNGA